ncbi:MAG: class I SAM-dependent methyltransferase [Opitutales bacterium]|nr:class I SAM-dependent methyltransferase [Opitutales bacterium]
MDKSFTRLRLLEEKDRLENQVKSLRRDLLHAYRTHSRFYVAIRSRLVPLDFFRMVINEAPTGCRIVDIGSGIGYFTLLLARLRPDIEFLGLELDRDRVKVANDVAQSLAVCRARFSEANLYETQFTESFDGVIALDLFHHLNEPASHRLVHEIYRCLRPGGTLWIKEIDTRPRPQWLFNYAVDRFMAPNDQFSFFSLGARIQQLKEAGFAEVFGTRLRSFLPYPHIMLRGRKPKDDIGKVP